MPSVVVERAEAGLNERQASSARVRSASRHQRRTRSWARGITGVLLLALAWEVLPRVGVLDAHFVPPLSSVLVEWWDMLLSGKLALHAGASLKRSLVGFVLALVTAVPLGAAIAWYTPVRELATPVMEIFRNTATLALLPVFTLVLGIGEVSKVAIVIFACFFPILLSTISGVATVDQQLLRSARVLGLSPVAIFFKVAFPAAVSTIFTGIRIAAEAAIIVLIAAEMIGATAGLGYLITYSQFNFLIPQMYAGILTTTAIGVAVNYGLVGLEHRIARWRA